MYKYTREQLLFYLKKLAKKLGRTPTIKDMNNHKKSPSASTYSHRYGSWNNALKAAGLRLNVRKRYSKKELLNNLKQLASQLGRVPKTTDLKKWTASYSTYRSYFGTWKKALSEAGIKDKDYTDLKKFTKKH